MGILNLPDEYSEIKRVDIQKDKKLALLVNIGAILIAIPLFIIGAIITPINYEIVYGNFLSSILTLVYLLVTVLIFCVVHELIHGVFFKLFSGKKVKYGFTGVYAFAGSEAYFNKREYLVIGLSPVIFLGIILLFLTILLTNEWFWRVYLIQIINLSGAAGDIYITRFMSKLPDDVLIKDEGIAMTIYSRIK